MGIINNKVLSFFYSNLKDNKQDIILEFFNKIQPVFLSELYNDAQLTMNFAINEYERQYLRVLVDFRYILPRDENDKMDKYILYGLFNRGLFCVAVDYILSFPDNEIKSLSIDKDIMSFLTRYEQVDNNLQFIINKINGVKKTNEQIFKEMKFQKGGK